LSQVYFFWFRTMPKVWSWILKSLTRNPSLASVLCELLCLVSRQQAFVEGLSLARDP